MGPAADEVVRFAADELARHVELICGAVLPRMTGTPATSGTVAVHLGVGLDDPELPPATSGHDGYRLLVRDDRVVVDGATSRGVLYGVYDLLERLGCRW